MNKLLNNLNNNIIIISGSEPEIVAGNDNNIHRLFEISKPWTFSLVLYTSNNVTTNNVACNGYPLGTIAYTSNNGQERAAVADYFGYDITEELIMTSSDLIFTKNPNYGFHYQSARTTNYNSYRSYEYNSIIMNRSSSADDGGHHWTLVRLPHNSNFDIACMYNDRYDGGFFKSSPADGVGNIYIPKGALFTLTTHN
jgi:hypothetical protein